MKVINYKNHKIKIYLKSRNLKSGIFTEATIKVDNAILDENVSINSIKDIEFMLTQAKDFINDLVDLENK